MPTQNKFIKYFKLLGLPKTATEEQITLAYKTLALSYHPDKVGKNEIEEANGYMSQLTEARNKLIEEYFPLQRSLKRRRSNQEEQCLVQQRPNTREPQGADHIPRKRQRQDVDPPQPAASFDNHKNKNETVQSTKYILPPIDVADIRSKFADMKNERILSYLLHTHNLTSTQLSHLKKSTKNENVIFATTQDVRLQLQEHLSSNLSPTSITPLSDQELDIQVNRLCQPELTVKWATNSKTACLRELVDVHGYDTLRTSKWTHWQMINELVRILSPTVEVQGTPITTEPRDSIEQQRRRNMISQLSAETNLTLEWAEKCLVANAFDYGVAKRMFEAERAKGTVWEGCYIKGAETKLLGWMEQEGMDVDEVTI